MIDYERLMESLSETDEPFGLLTMQAARTGDVLARRFPSRLRALFSAEHGFFGVCAAGEKTESTRHPLWDIPIHSLYGTHRKPTPSMLAPLGRMVIDLCDIGVRCYTYLATLKLMLEACAEARVPVTVLDRPVPMGGVVDGPMRADDLAGFVAPINVPLCHGMTPGEAAVWIRRTEALALDLTVVPLRGWNHASTAPWPNFVPPSPAIRSWDSAVLYPLLVFTEAYTAVDCDRYGPLAFRVIGAPWLDAAKLRAAVEEPLAACGLALQPYRYVPQGGKYAQTPLDGILFTSTRPEAYAPVTASAHLLAALFRLYAAELAQEARPEWMDKLYGSHTVRARLSDGALAELFGEWRASAAAYRAGRVDLYAAANDGGAQR